MTVNSPNKLSLVLIAHDIRSLHNVGSLFRTCDGVGLDKLYLTGHSGFPPRKEITKTALGAEQEVHWEHHWTLEPVIEIVRAQGYTVAAVERSAESQSYTDYAVPDKLALILGNEVTGVAGETMQTADAVLHVPMLGKKESLNVAVCAGIMLYGLRANWERGLQAVR